MKIKNARRAHPAKREQNILVMLQMNLPLAHDILNGIRSFALENNLPWDLISYHLDSRNRNFVPVWELHGCITAIPPSVAPLWLRKLHCPVINTCQNGLLTAYPQVDVDNRKIGACAARHLMEQGCHSFILVTPQWKSAKYRCQGFCDALRRRRLETVSLRRMTEENLRKSALLQYLEKGQRPIGIFCTDDETAFNVTHFLKSREFSIPDDVEVLGTQNNRAICESSSPTISSIDIPYREIGYEAAHILHEQMLDHKPPPVTLLPPNGVVVRQSTCCDYCNDKRITRVQQYIRNNLSSPLTVQHLATHAGCSRRLLEKLFVKHLRRAPHEEVMRLRMAAAKKLLTTTEDAMVKIAERCGLASATHFATAFKRATGRTPTQYRREQWGEGIRQG